MVVGLAVAAPLAAVVGIPGAVRAQSPNLFLNQAELDELRAVLAQPDAPAHVRRAFDETLAAAPRGADVETGFSPSIYTSDWHDRYRAELADGIRASDAALIYALTGDLEYAQAARTILLAWTEAWIGGGRGHGVADMGFIGLAWAYDLVRGSGVLSESDTSRIETWLLEVAAPLDRNWHPHGPTEDYYDDEFGRAAYQNEFAWNNALYAAVGYVTGERTRSAWATDQQWPYDDFGHHPEFSGGNPRSLREFIRGAIFRGSDRIVDRRTSSFFGDLPLVGEFLGRTVPDGSMYDFWHRGPSPTAGGQGQGYQLFGLQAMALHAAMAWHAGDDVFQWVAPNGNRLKDASDFARGFAAHADYPSADKSFVFLYELIHSHYGDPADLDFMVSSGRRGEPSGHVMSTKFPLIGYARRSGGIGAGGLQGITYTPGQPPVGVATPVFIDRGSGGTDARDSAPTYSFGPLPPGSYVVGVVMPEGFSSAEFSVCPPGETATCHTTWEEGTATRVEIPPEGSFVDLWWRFR